MTPLGDDSATRTAKVLSLPTRAAILSHLLCTGPKTVKEIAEFFTIHPNVARAHLDLMTEAGFLATEVWCRTKGRRTKMPASISRSCSQAGPRPSTSSKSKSGFWSACCRMPAGSSLTSES
jgi:predicted transcriptional regulator